jgi:hypothetical protein
MPMTKLAKQFELSDVGLRKICVKHQIPLPPMGYWIRKEFGKEVLKPNLPNTEDNPEIEINNEYKIKLNQELSKTKKALKKVSVALPEFTIREPNELKNERCITTYQEIKTFIDEIEKKQKDIKFETIKDKPPTFPPTHIFSFAYFSSSRNGFPLYATARNAIRAVCIADEIFERLEAVGIELKIEFDNRNGLEMFAIKQGERLEFHFREPYTKVYRTPALSKIEKQLRNDAWGSEKIDVPKNVLCLNFGWRSYVQKAFKDSGVRLENQIDNIIEYVVNKLDQQIEEKRQREIRDREYERKKKFGNLMKAFTKIKQTNLNLPLKKVKNSNH